MGNARIEEIADELYAEALSSKSSSRMIRKVAARFNVNLDIHPYAICETLAYQGVTFRDVCRICS